MATCYLGIGSNLGDRKKNIRSALKKINSLKGTKIIKRSRIIETIPLGCLGKQKKFFNAVIKIKTNLTPIMLLKKLKNIEKELGRSETSLPSNCHCEAAKRPKQSQKRDCFAPACPVGRPSGLAMTPAKEPRKLALSMPRTIDLDILFYGDKVISSKKLIVPHPRMFERDFVLRPLAEVI